MHGNRLLVVLMLAGLAFVCGASPAAAADQAKKPNIIFILADDLGIPGLGCYGGIYKTPNLNQLAAGGTRFEHCFAAPLCAPSRAMLMTGRYAFRTGVINNGSGINATPQKDGCVAQLMKQAGYATAVAGKWRQLRHFTTREDGAKWGFDEFLIWGAGLPDDEGAGKAGKVKTDRYWDPDYNLNGKTLKDTKGKYGPDVLQAFVIDFINRHKDGPFFVYYPSPLIHSPILPTPDSAKGKAARKGKGEGSLYADNIVYLDKQVGKLMAELDRLGIRENTVVVFSGDNGSVPVGTLSGRTVDGRKSQVNEGGSRVPLIASWPGTTPKGAVVRDLVDFSDLLPTFAEIAGAKLPTDRKIDGHSFAPQLRGEKGQPREWAYVQLGQQRYVRSERWKLTGDGKLFDMKDAPFKEIPIPADTSDAEAQVARAKLKSALDGLKSDDPLPKKKKKKAKT
jgi:arylsulfatase A-like enzyme